MTGGAARGIDGLGALLRSDRENGLKDVYLLNASISHWEPLREINITDHEKHRG